MKKNLCLLLVCLLSAAAPLQAQDMQQAQKLIDQAQKYLYNNPKQASYYAAQASALFPEDEPSEVRAQAMILYCQAEQLLGNFDLSIKNLYDTQKYIHPTNKKQMAQLCSLMGRVYSKLGDYNKAIELNDKATSIFKSIGDSTSVAGCYNERGVMHHFMSEFTVAERFFQRALAINRAQRNLKEIATNLNNPCMPVLYNVSPSFLRRQPSNHLRKTGNQPADLLPLRQPSDEKRASRRKLHRQSDNTS